MNTEEIDVLNACAEKIAGKWGVRATVRLVVPERSQVNTDSPQIELTVFREIAGANGGAFGTPPLGATGLVERYRTGH
jgi:hypothetical protein